MIVPSDHLTMQEDEVAADALRYITRPAHGLILEGCYVSRVCEIFGYAVDMSPSPRRTVLAVRSYVLIFDTSNRDVHQVGS